MAMVVEKMPNGMI